MSNNESINENEENPSKEDKIERHRSVPIPKTITSIGHGYPNKLVIFQLEASPYFWVRYFDKGKIYKKSTKTTNKSEAISFSKTFYENILLRQRNLLPIGSSPSFERCSQELILAQANLITRGERNPLLNQNDQLILKTDLLPYFRGFDVKQITYKHIDSYVNKISERKLAPATIKKHTNLLNKILGLAQKEGLIDHLPTMPKIKVNDSPRGWFDKNQYEHLRNTTKQLIEKKKVVRYHVIDDEMRHLITFMVNTFLRPSDIKTLRHRNIQIIKNDQTYLRIQTEQSKTINSPIVSMKAAVNIYEQIVKYQVEKKRPHTADDYVFFSHISNRDFALQTMRRQFDEILKEAKLKKSSTGEPRTLYSLRHTAIMFRLTLGKGIDLLTLARNARTSVDMIDRFYARPLQGEMNIDMIQSMRTKKKKTSVKKSIRKKNTTKKK